MSQYQSNVDTQLTIGLITVASIPLIKNRTFPLDLLQFDLENDTYNTIFRWHDIDTEHLAHNLIYSHLIAHMLHGETTKAATQTATLVVNNDRKQSLPFLGQVHRQVHRPDAETFVCLTGHLARALCRGGHWPSNALVFPPLGNELFLKFQRPTQPILQWYLAGLWSDLVSISKNLDFGNMKKCPWVTGN